MVGSAQVQVLADDADVLVEAFNKTTESEYTKTETIEEGVKVEIEEKANKKKLDFPGDNNTEIQDVDYEEIRQEEIEMAGAEQKGGDGQKQDDDCPF